MMKIVARYSLTQTDSLITDHRFPRKPRIRIVYRRAALKRAHFPKGKEKKREIAKETQEIDDWSQRFSAQRVPALA